MESAEEVKLIKYEAAQRNTHATGGTEANDSDDEDEGRGGMGGGQRVQCNQQ